MKKDTDQAIRLKICFGLAKRYPNFWFRGFDFDTEQGPWIPSARVSE